MKKGFTVVELMITLFVASLFIISGYQLYQVVVFRGSDARKLSEASTLAYEVLLSEFTSPGQWHPSFGLTHPEQTITRTNALLGTVNITLKRCRVQPNVGVMRVTATAKYDNPAKEVSHAVYVSQ